MVPPNPRISGILINPVVSIIKAGSGSLVSMRYNSKFRDLTYQVMQDLGKPLRSDNGKDQIPGLVTVNKKLAAKLEAKKKEQVAPVKDDPKKKGGAPPAKEPPAKPPAKGKGAPTAEEEAAEAERIR